MARLPSSATTISPQLGDFESSAVPDEEEEEEEDGEYTPNSSDNEEDITWIEWFCTVQNHDYFVEVDEDYIRDDFNLTGLSALIKDYDKALDIILDEDTEDEVEEDEGEEDDEENDDEENEDREAFDSEDETTGRSSSQQSKLAIASQNLYGLIHARFILTHRGLQAMLAKYNNAVFGMCPNVFCINQSVVPIGLSDNLGESRTNVFCPQCNEVYYPQSQYLAATDGAFFGTTFPHMFFLHHESLVPLTDIAATRRYYIPKVYGFSLWRGVKDLLRESSTSSSTSTLLSQQQQQQQQQQQIQTSNNN